MKSASALALATSGTAAAFSLAACCALPMLLVGAGLSPYWLMPVAEIGERLDGLLTFVSVLALGGAVVLVLRAGRTCAPGDLCARLWFRVAIVAFSALGAVLLVLSKLYA